MVSKQDETFLAIAQAGSVSKAAQGLYLSQPAVSRSLKRLEEDLGAQLSSIQAPDGTEYLWQGDPDIWARRAPVRKM